MSLFDDRLDQIHPEEHHSLDVTEREVRKLLAEACSDEIVDLDNKPKDSDGSIEKWASFLNNYRGFYSIASSDARAMVRSGIPPQLRGLAWVSMCESKSATLENVFESLANEWTPFVAVIERDLHRTFPHVRIFEDLHGEGQTHLGRILRAYSAYDIQLGYCQGLAFLAGPLAIYLSEVDAFCVLVKLLNDHGLRSMFTPSMSGLHLRIFQFERLLESKLPALYNHFTNLHKVPPIYATQWFLSFYATTCPLHLLVRIYDHVFAEGAVPTLLRVALAVLSRHQSYFLSCSDDERILQRLMSPSLWDPYLSSDMLAADICAVSVHSAELAALEAKYADSGSAGSAKKHVRAFSLPFKWGALATERLSSLSLVSSTPSQADSTASQTDASSAVCRRSLTFVDSDSDDSFSCDTNAVQPRHALLHELNETRDALWHERQRNAAMSSAVVSLLSSLDPATLSTLSAPVRDNLSQLNTLASSSLSALSEPVQQSDCSNCERLLLDLAGSRASEAMTRQKLDDAVDQLHQLEHRRSRGWSSWRS